MEHDAEGFMKQEKDKMNGIWVTPKEFFDPLCKEFDLKIDAAASADNAMLPEFWDESIDGLKQDWRGKRIWCNPPYGRQTGKWVEKAFNSDANIVVMLLPARTDVRWFHSFIYKQPRAHIRFIKGRIEFSKAGDRGKFPSMVVIFHPPISLSKGGDW